MKIKNIMLVILIALIFIIFTACSSNEDKVQNNNPINTDADIPDGEKIETDKLEVSDDLPEREFGGYNFKFYTNENTDYGNFYEIFAPESEIGEVVSDAVYKRNRTVEARFNINILTVSSGSDQSAHVNAVKKTLNAGDLSFDVAFVHCVWGPNLTIEGYACNLLEVPQFNFDKPWWQKQTIDELSLNGKMYLGSNSIFYSGLASSKVVYFNKDKIAEYGLEMPYQTALDGKWTMDRMIAATKDIYTDLNGDGKKDKNDFYGYVTFGNHNGFWTSCDIPILEKGGGDILKIVVNNERTITLVEKIYDWYYGSKGVLITGEPEHQDIFANGQALYAFGRMRDAVKKYRASEINYGILPLPKFDDNQPTYRVFSVDEFFIIPSMMSVDPDAMERTGIILEAMSAEGYKKIIPAYYEIALKNKYLLDEESVEVLDMITKYRTINFAWVYDNWEGFGHMSGDLFNDNASKSFAAAIDGQGSGGGTASKNFASYYEKREKAAQKRIDKIIKGFTDND